MCYSYYSAYLREYSKYLALVILIQPTPLGWKHLLEYVYLAFCWTRKSPSPLSFSPRSQHTPTLLDHRTLLQKPALISLVLHP